MSQAAVMTGHNGDVGWSTRARTLLLAVLLIGCVSVLVARPSAAYATSLARLSVEDATLRASTVAVGTVVGIQVERPPEGVRTAVRLRVDESLKGDASGLITVYVPGGVLPDGSRVTVDSMAVFAPGEICCVFADERGWVIGGYQGKVHLGGSGSGSSTESESALVRRVDAALSGEPAAISGPDPGVQVQSSASMLAEGPVIAAVTPGSASAGTRSQVTISGSGFGSAPGKVEFPLDVYWVERLSANEIVSWSDSEIICVVPTGSVGGFVASAGSGPLIVTHQNGRESNPCEFRIPFGYAGVKWPIPQATYLLDARGVDAELRERLVDAAAGSWGAAGSAFRFVDGGTTDAGTAADGRNVISWSDTVPDGVVAMTLTRSDSAGGIKECDVAFNAALRWGDGIAAGTIDVESIALHEFGHWLCLLDQYADADGEKVMYGLSSTAQRRELTPDDIAGIRWIYPAPSGSLHGTVHDLADLPIAGAVVTVETCEPTVSAPDGSFTVTGVPEGNYQVASSKSGYTTQVRSVTITVGQTSDTTFALALGEQAPIYRFYRQHSGSHFYTASVLERDRVRAKYSATYKYEGVAYVVNRSDPANSTPLYRFFNKKNGSHFYTSSTAERDNVKARFSKVYKYEGVAYNVAAKPSLATIPVYRFFNKKKGTHFYTASPAEKYRVIRTLSSTYVLEGPAYWVAP